MLNTDLHAMKRMNRGKSKEMSPEEFVKSVRSTPPGDEISEAQCIQIYEEVKEQEISLQPLRRVDFSNLPVQPDIEGWLLFVEGKKTIRRFWSVLALERLYLFADTDNMTPSHVIHLEHVNVRSAHPDLIRKNIESSGAASACGLCLRRKKGQSDCHGFVTPTGLPPGSERSAFILTTPTPQRQPSPRQHNGRLASHF